VLASLFLIACLPDCYSLLALRSLDDVSHSHHPLPLLHHHQDYIVNVHGFSESSDLMTILLDDENHAPPTFNNIIEALKTISEQAMPGDAVFVQFAGHGGRVLDAALDSEAESYDEVIVPADYTEYGLIRDTLLFKTLLAPMRYGVTVTIIIDCCDTGMVMELPYSWTTKSDKRDSVAKVRYMSRAIDCVFWSSRLHPILLTPFLPRRSLSLLLLLSYQ